MTEVETHTGGSCLLCWTVSSPLARGTHLTPFCDPAIPVAIPQPAKQGDNRSGCRLVKNEALCPCSRGQQEQIPRAAGRTRPWSGSPPHSSPSRGSRGCCATCPKNTAKIHLYQPTSAWGRNSLTQTEPSKKHSCRHGYWSIIDIWYWSINIDQWLKHPFGSAAVQNYKLDL